MEPDRWWPEGKGREALFLGEGEEAAGGPP